MPSTWSSSAHVFNNCKKPFHFKYVVKNAIFCRQQRTGYLNGEFIKDTIWFFFLQYLKAIVANFIAVNLEYTTAPKWDAWNVEHKKCLHKNKIIKWTEVHIEMRRVGHGGVRDEMLLKRYFHCLCIQTHGNAISGVWERQRLKYVHALHSIEHHTQH